MNLTKHPVLKTQQLHVRVIVPGWKSYLTARILPLQEAALTAVYFQGSHILWFHRLFWGCEINKM